MQRELTLFPIPINLLRKLSFGLKLASKLLFTDFLFSITKTKTVLGNLIALVGSYNTFLEIAFLPVIIFLKIYDWS